MDRKLLISLSQQMGINAEHKMIRWSTLYCICHGTATGTGTATATATATPTAQPQPRHRRLALTWEWPATDVMYD